MLSTDIRISVSFKDHRKRKRLRHMLGPGSTDYLIDLWIATAMNHPSGVLSGMDELDIALEAGWDADPSVFVDAMITCGFLERSEAGEYALHDWVEHQEWVINAPARKEKARNAAQARWGKNSNAPGMLVDKPGNANEKLQVCYEHARSNAPTNQPTNQPQEESVKSTDSSYSENPTSPPEKSQKNFCPAKEIAMIYNLTLPDHVQVRFTENGGFAVPEIERLIKARWNSDKEFKSLDFWQKFFSRIRGMPFLMGEVSDWKPNLGWIMGPKNFAKIQMGNYQTQGVKKQTAFDINTQQTPYGGTDEKQFASWNAA